MTNAQHTSDLNGKAVAQNKLTGTRVLIADIHNWKEISKTPRRKS
jgi:hypothetical protein